MLLKRFLSNRSNFSPQTILYPGVYWRIEIGFVPISWRINWRIEIGFVPVSWSRLENRDRIHSCILDQTGEQSQDSFLYPGEDWRIELGFVPASWSRLENRDRIRSCILEQTGEQRQDSFLHPGVDWRIEIGFVPVFWSRLENRARIRSCILESMLENRDRIRYMFYSLLRCLIYFKSECTIHNGTL